MLTTADRSSKNRSLYSSPVGCVSVRSLCVFEHCLFFAQLERFGGLPLAKRMPFTATIARTTTRVHPRSKITRVETLKGRKVMKGPFDDHVWQPKRTYGTPFLMLVTMVTTPKVMLCARADRASQSGTSQDWYTSGVRTVPQHGVVSLVVFVAIFFLRSRPVQVPQK